MEPIFCFDISVHEEPEKVHELPREQYISCPQFSDGSIFPNQGFSTNQTFQHKKMTNQKAAGTK